jgi:hypothetical protein
MSLWQKPIELLAFNDINAFLYSKLTEGHRLDYKLIVPKDLAKTIAAFANTLGGMIVLGVDGDKVTNEPIWPPINGMARDVGIADRIVQIATEAIYPPVRVSVGQVDNELLPGNQIVVIRVDESKDAPHAVEKGRKVFVYDRTDNKNDPHVLSDIDRIRYLLDRRNRIEDVRDSTVRHLVSRLSKALEESPKPTLWVSVAPVFPWRDLCKPSVCHAVLNEIADTICSPSNTASDVQRIPDGAMLRVKSRYANGKAQFTDAAVFQSNGICVFMRTALSLDRRHASGIELIEWERTSNSLELTSLWDEKIMRLLFHIQKFMRHSAVDMPGLLKVQLGFEHANDLKLLDQGRQGRPYLDVTYLDAMTLDASLFLSKPLNLDRMRNRLIFGFDLDTPEGM